MFYVTDLDDATQIVIEAETSSAFAKSDLEVKPNPTRAFQNAISTSAQVAARFGKELRPVMAETGADAEVSFSMKCDHTGLVMMAMNPDEGQFKVTMRFSRGAAKPNVALAGALAPLGEEPSFDDSQDDTAQ